MSQLKAHVILTILRCFSVFMHNITVTFLTTWNKNTFLTNTFLMLSLHFKVIQKLQDQGYKNTWKIDNTLSKINGTHSLKFVKISWMSIKYFIRMMTLLWEVTFLKNWSALIRNAHTAAGLITCILTCFIQQINTLKSGLSQELLTWSKNIWLLVKASLKIQTNKSKWKWFFPTCQKTKLNKN